MGRYLHFGGKFSLVDEGFDLLPDGRIGSEFTHGLLHFDEVILLWAQNRPRPGYAYPPYELCSWEVVVLHGVASDECTRSSQSGLAVNGQSSLCTFGIVQEVLYDFEGGHTAIREV